MYKYKLSWINRFWIDSLTPDYNNESKDFDSYAEAYEYYKKLKRQNTSDNDPNGEFSLIKYRDISLEPKIVFGED